MASYWLGRFIGSGFLLANALIGLYDVCVAFDTRSVSYR
jgi:hypothetical protein